MPPSIVDPAAAAVVVMDFQAAVVEAFAPDPDGLLARTAGLLEGARAIGMRVIYVVIGFRDGYPEIGRHSPTFGPVRDGGRFAEGAAGTAVHAAVTPRSGDVVVTKRRVSAFFGTDLDLILRSNGISTLILAGVATSGVVLSTVRHATDADYRVVVVEDCCADRDPEVHRVLVEKVFARWTTVVKAADVFAPAAP